MSKYLRKPSVLLVDDDPDSLEVLSQALKQDYRVTVATDGASALALARQEPPDVILLDIIMPGQDGYQVCRELKADATTRDIPVIFVTARHRFEDQEAGFQAGGADYLTKPLHASIVRLRVGNQVQLRRQAESQCKTQSIESLTRLTGGIAHDFNNILGIILGNLEFLRPLVAQNELAAKRVKAASNAAMRAADLVSQLLDFSRTEPKEPAPTDLNLVVREMQEGFVHSLPPGVTLETCLADRLWLTLIDRDDLMDALDKLIDRSRHALREGGKITIETSNRILDGLFEAHHPSVEPGDYLQLVVADNGPGLTPEEIDHIFEPYFGSPAHRDKGLGLSTVYSFAQRSGGFIKVQSKPGAGTRFRLFLPRFGDDSQPMDPKSHALRLLPGKGETILIVDDEGDILDLTKMRLDALNYLTLIADNGEQALAILERENSIDLLFTDVVMPGGMDGYELARRAKTIRPNLKVLFTSGYMDANVLTKPYTQAELAQWVRSALD